ncbi:MAG: MFS transporter [Pseudomonadota bacterium]
MPGKPLGVPVGSEAAGFSLPLSIGLAALSAAAMNLLLPVLPLLQESFDASHGAVQTGLTSFLVGSAAAQLALGPLSQHCGWRALLTPALLIFCSGSVLAAMAPSLEAHIAGRFLQGVGGAASLVLAEALTASVSRDAILVRRMGYLNAGMAAAILLAPVAGAVIGTAFGWRTICWAAFAAGIILLVLNWRGGKMPPEESSGPHAPAAPLLLSRRFVGHSLCAGFVMVNYFCLAAFGPSIGIGFLGLTYAEYGLVFALLGAAYIAGNLASSRVSRRYGQRRSTAAALAVGIAAGGTAAALAWQGRLDIASFIAMGCVIGAVTGVVLPNASGAALDGQGMALGAAAAVLNLAIFGIGALTTHVVGSHVDGMPLQALTILPVATALALLAVLVAGGPPRPPHSSPASTGDTP